MTSIDDNINSNLDDNVAENTTRINTAKKEDRRPITKIDKSKQLRVDQLLGFKYQHGLHAEVGAWLELRREYYRVREAAKDTETIPSDSKYKGLNLWRQEMKKEYIPGYQKTLLKPIKPNKAIRNNDRNGTQNNTNKEIKPIEETPLQRFTQKLENALKLLTPANHKELLVEALSVRHTRYLELLFAAKVDFNLVIDKFQRTMLHHVVFDGDIKKIEYLLSHGADVTCRDWKGKIPLHLAIQVRPEAFQMLRIIRLLIEAGSDVKAVMHDGSTALHLACIIGEVRIVRILLQANADVFVLNDEGKLAITLAKTNSSDIVDEFRRNETSVSHERHNLMWSHILSREFVAQVFKEVEPACIKCRRKYSQCAMLKLANFRFWLLVHEVDML